MGCGEGNGKWVCGAKMGSGRRGFRGGQGEETSGFHGGGGGRLEEGESVSACFCDLSYHHPCACLVFGCVHSGWCRKKRRVNYLERRDTVFFLSLNFSFSYKIL